MNIEQFLDEMNRKNQIESGSKTFEMMQKLSQEAMQSRANSMQYTILQKK